MTERWDRVVRVTHWAVAFCFLLNRLYVTTPGSIWHQTAGLAIVLLIFVRLGWGVTAAPAPARLSAIIPTKKGIIEHLHELRTRKFPAQLHHNPVGSIGILLFWFLLPLVALSGWGQNTHFIDLYPVDKWHKWLVNTVTVLVCIHIAAVVAMSFLARKNLLRAMLPGWRSKD